MWKEKILHCTHKVTLETDGVAYDSLFVERLHNYPDKLIEML